MANPPDSTTAKQHTDLVFVNVSDLAGSGSQNVRRLVRSSATRHSHRDPLRKPKARKAARSARRSSADVRSAASSSRGNSPVEIDNAPVENGPLFSLEDRSAIEEQIREPSSRAVLDIVAQALSQPNNAYPVEPEEWFPWLLSYYRTEYLQRGIIHLQLSSQEGADFIYWMLREGSTEPALFYAQLLSACEATDRIEQHVEWLKAKSMQSLNDAVGDATRVLRPATLIAIALAALRENVHGSRDVAVDIHGRAFARLLSMRGISAVHIPRLAWKYLLWIDDVLSSTRSEEVRRLMECWIPGYREHNE